MKNFGEYPLLLTCSKPIEASAEAIGPDIAGFRSNRLEYLDEGVVDLAWDQPSAKRIAKLLPTTRGGMHVNCENVEIAEPIWPGLNYDCSCLSDSGTLKQVLWSDLFASSRFLDLDNIERLARIAFGVIELRNALFKAL